MSIEKVLIVDDELIMRDFLAETLRRKNFDVHTADCGKGGLDLLKGQSFDLVITDMKMPDISGIEILKRVKETSPSTLVIIITAFGSIDNAVEAMRLGAFNYLLKPFSPDAIEAIIEKAHEHVNLVEENNYLRKQVSKGQPGEISNVVAESPKMKSIIKDLKQIAESNSSVFITGESGTGKEVIAHLIHYQSPRNNRPFIRVNCAAIPETLIESEFFGHEKGAFTGADAKRLGRFELANGGTLFLDEVTETPPSFQSKLLRATQEQEFERVGGSKSIKVDVRLISTSNRNMQQAIEEKKLREDLFYRLNVVPIHLPPLRERKEDIIPLAKHFIHQMCVENNKEMKSLTNSAEERLLSYGWPGNVRELANLIERSVVMNPSTDIKGEDLLIQPTSKTLSSEGSTLPPSTTLKELEKKLIIERMHQIGENKTKVAESLGIHPRTLRNKIKEYGIH